MNKINLDLEKQKIDYKWNAATIINSLFIIVYILVYFCLEDKFEYEDSDYNQVFSEEISISTVRELKGNINELVNKNKILKEKIDELIKDKKELQDKILVINRNKDSSTKKNLGKNCENIITTENENASFIKEKEILEKKIFDINKEKDILKNEKVNLEKKIIKIRNEKNYFLKEKDNLEKKIIDITNERDNFKKVIDDISKEKENSKKDSAESINGRVKYTILPIKPGDIIMSINFVSIGVQDINNFSLVCKNTDLFITEEERLYENFPKYKKEHTYFEVNAKKIKRFQTLDVNGIKNNDVIYMFVIEQ